MAVAAFDVRGPLPTGTTVLEASAGTGKTFTIAALATRYVAEGRAKLRDLLLVTFGRAATAELRQRVRERLVSAERGLASGVIDPGDVVLTLLADAQPDEIAQRRRRLAAAVADFDAATIATTHQFCHQVLAGLGIAADTDPDGVFVDDLEDLITEVVDDLYVRKYATPDAEAPEFTRAMALDIARHAVTDSQARLEPDGSTRFRFAAAVRHEVERRKRQRRLFGFDDMLTGLDRALTDPVRGETACRRLRERYSVVLVDEFQDTDPVQWNIVRTAFHGHTTLVLIGDPKQAIYAFRGADVISYLSASGDAPAHATLGTNWRSDRGVLSAFETVFGTAALGDKRIAVRPVAAAWEKSRLSGPPFRLRVLRRDGFALNKWGLVSAPDARTTITEDLAAQVMNRLADGSVAPGDVAVLVRTHRQSAQIQTALSALGLPAVQAGTTSVFGTPAGADWLALLEGLEQPHRGTRVAAAALTGIVGWSASRLAAATEEELDELGTTLRQWQRLVTTRGVAALLEAVTATGMPARLLARRSGERHLTDLRHVGMALHAAAVEGGLGLTAVTEWLRRRIEDAPHDVGVERSRRLESDADAVQIVTVHSSKGLEYPVVFLPFGWDRHVGKPELLRLHDEAGSRVIDVGGSKAPGYRAALRRHRAEEDGEDLRLMYVALTRAASQVVAWWAPTANTKASALHRFLFGRPAEAENPSAEYDVPSDDDALARLGALSSESFAVETLVPSTPVSWSPAPTESPALAAAPFRRRLDLGWRRTSYSRLTAGQHDEPGVASEPGTAENDEPAVPVPSTLAAADGVGLLSPMAGLPTGAAFGTMLHTVLERCDFAAPDLHESLTSSARATLGPSANAQELATALIPALHTSLGPLADGRRLIDFARTDRLDELEFELPLQGGDRPKVSEAVRLSALADLLERHLEPAHPLFVYADRLRSLGPEPLRGYLTGSIDLVLRLPGPRYVVADYKSNWLGPFDGSLTAYHYRPDALHQAMMAAHYPLQALLYSAALHRYLRWRQPGYDPAQHLGGVLYLFLRGMCGPPTPAPGGIPYGVFSWHPPHELVTELSELLDGVRT
ncbi:UvrD-helicase domain-containing protein [Paractinoplanes lichenicola]|uniref:RecBCD enzyme subunit RecB n=1 Tax=Paractinoplanes lichenicola TaxID=2802976 RepID=A0ABS1VM44_9ACTN|nr:UvrD-helicase domain-containing protein [Actinoplanes lichenicola]MBL7255803.1 UvrD-helicase domain-containing protein [Actinoplanes lichenicola]